MTDAAIVDPADRRFGRNADLRIVHPGSTGPWGFSAEERPVALLGGG